MLRKIPEDDISMLCSVVVSVEGSPILHALCLESRTHTFAYFSHMNSFEYRQTQL